MKKYPTSTLGYKIEVSGPSTNSEYDQAAGGTDLACQHAVEGVIAWDTLPTIQDAFAAKIKELTGIERRVDTAKTDKAKARSEKPDSVKPVLETVKSYHAFVLATADDETKAKLKSAIEAIAAETVVDVSPTARASKVGAEYLERADKFLGEPEKLEDRIAKMRDYLGDGTADVDRTDDGTPVKASLARLIKAYSDKKLQEEL